MSSLRLNPTIWALTISDIFSWGLYFATTSLVGVYLSRQLGVNALEIIGIGGAFGLIVRALTQIPLGILADKIFGSNDEISMLVLGNILMGVPFLVYPDLQSAFPYYLLQIVFGLGAACNLVNWRKLFAKALNKDGEGSAYAMYDCVLSLCTALYTAAAGILANNGPEVHALVIRITGVIILGSIIGPLLIFWQRKNHRFTVENRHYVD